MKTNLCVVLCLGLALAAILTEVQCHKRGKHHKKRPRTTVKPLPTGWKVGNGRCICNGLLSSMQPRHSNGPHPSGNHGPYPTRPHRLTGPRPSGHHGPHPSRPHRPTGPRPLGHHGRHPPRHHGRHPWRPHRPTGPRPSGHHGPHPFGHRRPSGRRPTGNMRRCVCGPRSKRRLNIKMRLRERWLPSYADDKSPTHINLKMRIQRKMIKVLNKIPEEMYFSEGSIVVKFSVIYNVSENGSPSENPEKLLRDALKGELKDLNIYPDSLAVSESYSGVKLSEWKTSAHQCIIMCHSHGKKLVLQTRTCTELNATCEGIPLSREVCCEKACHLHLAKHRGFSKANKVLVISCVVVAIIFVVAVAIILTTVKKSRRKYVSTSPSTSSLKQLANNDQLQQPNSKC